MSALSRLRPAFTHKGLTARLPVYFAVSLLIAAVFDVIAAFVSFSTDPDDVGAAFQIATAFLRPGAMTVAIVAVLVIAFVVGARSDARVLHTVPSQQRGRNTPALFIAGWVAVTGGVIMAVLAIGMGVMLWTAAQEYPGADRPSDAVIALIAIGITAGGVLLACIPVWLGALVLRRRRWARYALIAYCAVAGVLIAVWPLLRIEPLIAYGTVAIAVLLVWVELRERGLTGSFRSCWRGFSLLIFNLGVLAVYAMAGMSVGGGETSGGLVVVSLSITVYYLVALVLAMWAVKKDGNELWAGLDAAIVVAAPVLISISGLVTAVVNIPALVLRG